LVLQAPRANIEHAEKMAADANFVFVGIPPNTVTDSWEP
jgi:hypothetical protein